ncbi:highly divergent homeobox isoform X6 [Podarcis raffonei]|uniref:highly divergent homeobox isoform X6 n=1 Tax=Podarcis raffonei TaxID=65483 RepID=UPI0023295681|nr:highly divergent homeobox isoform X6 [Podarcis raffonei]
MSRISQSKSGRGRRSKKIDRIIESISPDVFTNPYSPNPPIFENMNLRSVFTAEQQRILQRYYENGMTNQSKNCFQLILQCAQETKLDFSVVRTWVGNKRRKMSSKNVVDSGGTPSGTVASTLNIPTVTNVRSLANLASPQTQQASWTSSNNDVMVTGVYTPARSSHRLVSTKQSSASISGNLPAPWTMGSSRKRALQDRTQFSDRDLATLKRYWDRGMTSLGAICREKIEAVAAELNVDCEIVRTWIGNRRRKYRLMGIEVLPPLGGPALFPNQSDSSSRSITIPEDDASTDVGDDNDRNDEVSICLSEESSQEEQSEVLQNEDTGHGREDQATLTDTNGTIQIIDDEEDGMISEIEQLNCLLEFKTQEVRFAEEDLEHEKKKYAELQAFTRRLILAVKMDDKEQQQALLADLPPDLEEMDFNHSFPEPDDTSFSLSSSSEKNTSDSL